MINQNYVKGLIYGMVLIELIIMVKQIIFRVISVLVIFLSLFYIDYMVSETSGNGLGPLLILISIISIYTIYKCTICLHIRKC